MTEEHKPSQIEGYRNLTPDEIELINDVKRLGRMIEGSLAMIGSHLRTQREEAQRTDPRPMHLLERDRPEPRIYEIDRIEHAEPGKWLAIARTHFQQGLMAAARAVAQPTNF